MTRIALALFLALGLPMTARAASTPPAGCVGSDTLGAIGRVDAHTLQTGSGHRIDLDPGCAGLQDGEPMQLASTREDGAICPDGKAAAISPGAICPVVAIREHEGGEAPRCFRTARVRSFAALRGNRLEVQLRRGETHVLQLEASCAQLDRFAAVRLVSGSDDGRICGRPGDAVYGSSDDGMGQAMGGGFANQMTANDFQPCRIIEVLPAGATPEGG